MYDAKQLLYIYGSNHILKCISMCDIHHRMNHISNGVCVCVACEPVCITVCNTWVYIFSLSKYLIHSIDLR